MEIKVGKPVNIKSRWSSELFSHTLDLYYYKKDTVTPREAHYKIREYVVGRVVMFVEVGVWTHLVSIVHNENW